MKWLLFAAGLWLHAAIIEGTAGYMPGYYVESVLLGDRDVTSAQIELRVTPWPE